MFTSPIIQDVSVMNAFLLLSDHHVFLQVGSINLQSIEVKVMPQIRNIRVLIEKDLLTMLNFTPTLVTVPIL